MKKIYQIFSAQLSTMLEKLQAIAEKTVNPATKEDVANKATSIGDVNKGSTTQYPSLAAITSYVDTFTRVHTTSSQWSNYNSEMDIIAPYALESVKVSDIIFNTNYKTAYICTNKTGSSGNIVLHIVPLTNNCYTKTEIDTLIGNIETLLSQV